MKTLLLRGAALGLFGWLVYGQLPQPDGGPVQGGVLPAKWITGGPKCMEVPDWQVHEYNEDFYILRESGCVHYEKPFLYLIFGKDRAMLEDTGAGRIDVKSIVDTVLKRWLQRKGRESIPLLVMHSHGHSDHVAGDSQFQNIPGVDFIPATVEGQSKAFGIQNWPEGRGQIDLGGRVLDVVAVPGHHAAAVALYDRRTGILLTGDNLYPGRLYVFDWPAFVKSTQRLLDFTERKVITHVLGTHIEQQKYPYREYPIGSIYQPEEHVLEMSRGDLMELNEALRQQGSEPARIAYRNFTIWPMPPAVLEEMKKTREETETRQRKTMWAQP